MGQAIDKINKFLDEEYSRGMKDGLSSEEATNRAYDRLRETALKKGTTFSATERAVAFKYGDDRTWKPSADLEQKWEATSKAEDAGARAEEAFAGITVPGMGRGPVGLPGGDLSNPLARRGGASQQQTDPLAELRATPTVMSDEEISRYLVDTQLGTLSEADPQSMAAMQKALDAMEGVYQAGPGGFLEGQRQAVDQRIRQQRQAALSTLQQRGQYGGGAELAMLLGSGQDAAQSRAAVDSDAMQLAMDAMTQGYNMAGGIHDARQRIADFNNSVVRQNTMLNQSLRHQQALDRLGEERAAQSYNRELPWRQFGGQLQLGAARSGAASGTAGTAVQLGQIAQQAEQARLQQEAQTRAAAQQQSANLWNAGITAAQVVGSIYGGPAGGAAAGAAGRGLQGLLTEDQVF